MKMASITIGEYLLKRLKELNIETIFGVPGDYNLPLLDLIEEDKDITWGNNTNELNAAYAADGYARIRGAGALVTTFGVGELSAINGVAGSFSEMLPVIHVVGTPITSSQLHKTLLHHSLGNGDFKVFAKMSSMITVASACLTHEKALEQIDYVIRTSFVRKQPGYIAIPLDLMKKQVELSEPFMDALQLAPPTSPPEIMQIALEKILELVKNATYPAIVVDGCILRHHLQKEANAFVIKSGFLTFAAPMGKGAIDESLPNFRGCYSGNVSLESIKREIEQADLLIELGSIKSDFNTGNFSYGLEKAKTIALHSFGTTVYYAEYPGVSMMDLLPLLTSRLPEKSCQLSFGPRGVVLPIDDSMQEITHNYLWNKVSEYIEPNSIVLGETGTAEFGLFNMKSTPNTTYISQVLWGSIGYTVGACLGSAMANRDRRVYLFVGDGSFQVTGQEVSVMMRHGLAPVIILLNNDGYLIEKLIHGMHCDYNNFFMWEYTKALDYFGANLENNKAKFKYASPLGLTVKVKTRKAFEEAMQTVKKQRDKIHFVEVILPQFDAPHELILQVESSENH